MGGGKKEEEKGGKKDRCDDLVDLVLSVVDD